MRALVSVCVCTYHRPELLQQLLQSLRGQCVDGFDFEVVVVDNDGAASSRQIVDRFIAECPGLIVRYDIEPKQGISYARNRTVSIAEGEFLAFIDDDEQATPDWLFRMVATQRATGADAVFGPVIPMLPHDAPRWATEGHFYERVRFPTGTHVSSGDARTGNALVRASAIRARGPCPFDVKLAHSGGEDHEFFRWMEMGSARFVWADDAIVREVVPYTRLSVGYVIKRKLRSSVTYWRIAYPSITWPKRMLHSAVGLVAGTVWIATGLLAMPFSIQTACRLWSQAMSAFGRVLALTSVDLEGYRRE